ncbi:MAG TPA: hypothetical protein VKG25_20105 [Bryobacteraceae bacterium]|nr:hypothetical protein [Bryobacteraceae bacterium]
MREIYVVLLLLLALASGSLWGQVVPPRIGFVSDTAGELRPVLGVAGNFLLGDAVANSVVSSGFSGTFTFVKTDTALSIIDAGVETDFQVGPGPALFSFFGHAGFAYFVSDGTLHRWDGVQLTTVALDLVGEVLGLAQPDANHVWIAVRQNNLQVYVLTVDGVSGAIETSAPLTNVDGNLALLNDREFLFTNGRGLILRRANGAEIALAAQLKGAVSFEQLGAGWWSVKDSSGGHYVFRAGRDKEAIYQLPENAP